MSSPEHSISTDALVDSLIRKGLSGHEIAIGVAAIIYLRWLDFQESEQEAIALFEGAEYQSGLPAEVRWSNWPSPEDRDLSAFFANVVIPGIDESPALSYPLRRAIIEGLLSFTRDSDDATPLRTTIRWVKTRRLERPRDRRGLLQDYDELLGRAQRLDPHRIYPTPGDLARLMTACARPEPGMRVYDPCFGTAQLLTSALTQGIEAAPPRHEGAPRTTVISGAEQDPGRYLTGLVRTLLAGADAPRLWLGNALERPHAGSGADEAAADLILANPPVGARLPLDGLGHYPVQSPDSTVLFVQHVMQQLAPNGRAVVLVPQGFLYRRGKETEVRTLLGRNGWVDAVIGLPRRVDGANSLVPRALLLLSKGVSSPSVRMVDGEGLLKARGYRPGEPMQSDAIAALLEAATGAGAPTSGERRFSWDEGREALAGIDWDLTPKRRDATALEQGLNLLADTTPIQPLAICVDVLTPLSVAAGLVHQGSKPAHAIPYLRIGDVQRGEIPEIASWVNPLDLTRGSNERALRASLLHEGDVLLARYAELDKVALIRDTGVGAIAATGFFVLRPSAGYLSGEYLAAYLRSSACRDWLKAKATGGSVGRVPIETLRLLPVPIAAIPIQEKVATFHTDHGVDALTGLLRVLDPDAATQDKAAIAQWISRAFSVLDEEARRIDEAEVSSWFFPRLLEEPLPVRHCAECGKAYSLRDVGSPPGLWRREFRLSRILQFDLPGLLQRGPNSGIARGHRRSGDQLVTGALRCTDWPARSRAR